MGSTRQLAAILFADIEGYSALMHQNEQLAAAIREKFTHETRSQIKAHGGRVVQFSGDGALCVFSSSISAVQAAISLQLTMRAEPQVPVRIGIHSGDVMLDETDIYGDGVNIASRVESFAVAGGIFISGKIHEEIKNQPNIQSVPLGRYQFKNIDHPIELFAISNPGINVPNQRTLIGKGERYSGPAPWLKRNRTLVAVLSAVLVFGAYALIQWSFNSQKQGARSVAVLPFDWQGSDSAAQFLADGMNEDILTQISKIRDITVISNATMKAYKNTALTPVEVGKTLDAETVLKGTVRLRGNNLRVFAELIDVATSNNIWAQTFDENYDRIFDIQSKLAETIADVLKATLSTTEKNLIRHQQTGNIAAYEIYLKGRDLYSKFQRSNNDEAIGLFREAIDRDPTYALAWAGLADAFAQKNVRFGEATSWLDSAQKAADKSLALDSTLAEGYKSLGVTNYYRGLYDRSQVYLEKAVALNPNYSQAISNLGVIYFVQGQLAKTIQAQKKSAAMNPLNQIPFQIIGWCYRLLGNYADAQQWLEKSLKIKPFLDAYREMAYTHIIQGNKALALPIISQMVGLDSTNTRNLEFAALVAHMAGQTAQAKTLFEKALQYNPNLGTDEKSITPVSLGQILLYNGQRIDAEIYLDNCQQLNLKAIDNGSQDDDPRLVLAAIEAIKGNKAAALGWLGKAMDAKFYDYGFASTVPWFASLRTEPQFVQMLAAMKQKMQEEAKLLN